MKAFFRVLLFGTLALGWGCSLMPEFIKPPAPVPASWPTGPSYKPVDASERPLAVEMSWEEFVTDWRLKEIILQALANNRDLRLAALNVERARALYGIQRAELFPSLSLSASASTQRVPADLSGMGKAVTLEQYSVNLGISAWEIDFFGRIRSLKERALQEYLATAQARRSVQILLVSQLSSTFLALAADQERLRLAISTLEVQQSTYDLIQKRYELGLASELDLSRARTQVEVARGDVARFTQLVAQDRNGLELLAGAQIREELLPQGLSEISPPRRVSAGLSSEVLLRRPDILAAEHRLRAANADIGAARAAFFPRISLTTALGTASSELTALFKAGSGAWSYIPQLVMPIFDARLWSALKASKVQQEIVLAEYEKAIQGAFRETADALAEQGALEDQLQAQADLVQATEKAHALASLRHMNGLDSYLSVLDAQRSLYAAQQALVGLQLAELANRVRLYAVLGGGADEEKEN